MPAAPRFPEIEAAAARIAGVATRTPLRRMDRLAEDGAVSGAGRGTGDGREIWIKLETGPPIRSFKIRGAASAMLAASREALARGVWTASAGNMAQGAAYVARELGVPCRVVVPDHAPRAKLERIADLGAECITVPFEAWWRAMLTHAHPGMDGQMIHPFADTAVMAGNGTIGLELVADAPDLDAVLAPWGGGGLALGIASALEQVSPRTKVYAVEVETAAPLTASLAAGRPVTVTRTATWIDGMGSDRVSDEMWPLVPARIAGTVVVTVEQVAAALRHLHATAGVTAEGAGAAAVAAAFGGRLNGVPGASLDARRVACIVSGGNIDADVVARIVGAESPAGAERGG